MLKPKNCMSGNIILEDAIQKVNLENFILKFLPIWNIWDLWINKSVAMLEILF